MRINESHDKRDATLFASLLAPSINRLWNQGIRKAVFLKCFLSTRKRKAGDILKRAIKKAVKRNRVYPFYFLLEKIEIKTLSGNVR